MPRPRERWVIEGPNHNLCDRPREEDWMHGPGKFPERVVSGSAAAPVVDAGDCCGCWQSTLQLFADAVAVLDSVLYPRPSGSRRARPRSVHFPEGRHGSILEGDRPSRK